MAFVVSWRMHTPHANEEVDTTVHLLHWTRVTMCVYIQWEYDWTKVGWIIINNQPFPVCVRSTFCFGRARKKAFDVENVAARISVQVTRSQTSRYYEIGNIFYDEVWRGNFCSPSVAHYRLKIFRWKFFFLSLFYKTHLLLNWKKDSEVVFYINNNNIFSTFSCSLF
jgi:hypothetical protein